MDDLQVTISYLELLPPIIGQKFLNKPEPQDYKIINHDQPEVRLFRHLYHGVGHEWGWYEQKYKQDSVIAERLRHPLNDFYLLVPKDKPIDLTSDQAISQIAGFLECDRRNPAAPNIHLFGLVKSAQGKGLGPFLLAAVLDELWQANPKPEKITVDTCTLDHPNALSHYLNLGFKLTHTQEKRIKRSLLQA